MHVAPVAQLVELSPSVVGSNPTQGSSYFFPCEKRAVDMFVLPCLSTSHAGTTEERME